LALFLPVLVSLPFLQGAQKKSAASTKKKAPAKEAASSKAATRSAKSKSATASRSGKSKSRRRVAQSTGQRLPEPDRIKEIQSALASRGYDVSPTGVWDSRSIAAVKQFQEANNINNFTGKGKLDSLTLIALGLGPNHGAQAQEPKPNTEGQQP
jgi:peptidoglycan hydrolase-like protein with peptidoglycan-binding domain